MITCVIALIDFDSLADYERYREKLAGDPAAQENFARGMASGSMLAESRSFFRRV
ncbi:MAG TPA: NIPSNAP family protein [Gaiellaceae bacterium]|nr:NIPSNAP family protein [Gaiellaceae bacterium]